MEQIKKIISSKYKFSKNFYTKIFDDEDPKSFIFTYDMINPLPIFPTPISIKINFNHHNKTNKIHNDNITQLSEQISIKTKEIKNFDNIDKCKFFPNDFIKNINTILNTNYINLLWLSISEIFFYHKIFDFDNINHLIISNDYNTILLATKHHLKSFHNYKHYVHSDKIDAKFNYNVITITTNLNDDSFTEIEKFLSVSTQGANMIIKINGLITNNLSNIIYKLTLLFDKIFLFHSVVYNSDEINIYLVCKNLFFYNKFELNDYFYKFISKFNKMITKIFTLQNNFFIFLTKNQEYIIKNKDANKYIRFINKHYLDFYIKYFKFKKVIDN